MRPTAAQVAFELMLEGGTGHAAYDRLTVPSSASSSLHHPPSSPVWILTAQGWRCLAPAAAQTPGTR